MNQINYYIVQSKITCPGRYGWLFDSLSHDIVALCKMSQGLILHYADEELFQYKIPSNRFEEMDIRHVENMLDLIFKNDERPLNIARPANQRIIGICRDNSALICSVLRHKKIPARLRAGFIDYLIPGLYLDGICVEYWNKDKQRWCFVDTRTTELHIEKLKISKDLNIYDLPDNRFITAGNAWRLCRDKKINSNRFGSRMHRGLWYVRNRLLHDFALINKQEILIWDLWGIMLDEKHDRFFISDLQLAALDELSDFINFNAYNINEIHAYYEAHQFLHVPEKVWVDNPFLGMKTINMSY